MPGSNEAAGPQQPPAERPDDPVTTIDGSLVRETETLPDGRRITYYRRPDSS